MPTLLHIDASPRREQSVSRSLSAAAVRAMQERYPDIHVDSLDLASTPVPVLNGLSAEATALPPEARTDSQAASLSGATALVAQLKAADLVVIGTPMHNFGMPAVLKGWFDAVIRSGETFSITESGPQGLLGDMQVLAIVASGGNYRSGALFDGMDHLTPHLRTLFGWVGFANPQIVHVQPTTFEGEEARAEAIATAERDLAAAVASILL